MTERLRDSGRTAFRSWVALTQKLAEQEHPDLVVWPEGAIPFNPHEGKARDLLSAMVKQGNFWFLAGGGTSSPDPTNVENAIHWNSAYLFSPDGEVAGRYDKMVPLPFGEYLPWPFSYLRPYIEGVGNFRAGSTPHVFSAGDFTFTTPICYEAILESQMRRLMDADLFVNITNDGWFGDTAAPRQHAMLAAVQAMEFGRPMVRIAYTGISMIVEPHGRILYETKPYTDVSEVVPLRLGKVDTPYRSWGGWFPPICSLVAVGAVFAAVRRERSTAAVTPRIAAS
jgi:apolipoprotein N-acyltransferase